MPAPLLWFGAACLGLYASNRANDAYLKSTNTVRTLPGESSKRIAPRNGAIVTCGIYGVLDHTGVWVNGNIYELSGKGLIRSVSPERFLHNRTGKKIYVACDEHYMPLAADDVSQRCIVAEMLTGERTKITSFSELNEALSSLFLTSINWHEAKVDFR